MQPLRLEITEEENQTVKRVLSLLRDKLRDEFKEEIATADCLDRAYSLGATIKNIDKLKTIIEVASFLYRQELARK